MKTGHWKRSGSLNPLVLLLGPAGRKLQMTLQHIRIPGLLGPIHQVHPFLAWFLDGKLIKGIFRSFNQRIYYTSWQIACTFMTIGHCDTRHEFVLAVGLETVTNKSLIFCQLGFKVQRIPPVKRYFKISRSIISPNQQGEKHLPFSGAGLVSVALVWAAVLWNLTHPKLTGLIR